MRSLIFGVLRFYIVIVMWLPLVLIMFNFEKDTFFKYFLILICFLLGLGSTIYLAKYYNTDKDY